MRNIKFRGKRVDNGEWVVGNYVSTDPAEAFILIGVTGHIKRDDYECYMVEVIPETVGQFTGLKDSKGIDIYEGQIINDRIQDCVVQWDTREAKFNLSILYNDEAFDIRQTHKPMPLDAMGITIIGDLCDKV